MTDGRTGLERTNAGCSQGFTLLEVLVALVLLAGAGIIILQLFSAGTRSIARSEDYINAEVRAEARMREVLDRQAKSPGAWGEQTADGYRIDVEVSDVMQERTADLPVRLVEISLTIRWKRNMVEKCVSLKTLKTIKREIITKAAKHV